MNNRSIFISLAWRSMPTPKSEPHGWINPLAFRLGRGWAKLSGCGSIRCIMAVVLILVAVFAARPLWAEDAGPTSQITLTTAWSVDKIRPGDTAMLAVVFRIPSDLHINADAAQLPNYDAFKPVPTRIRVFSATDGLVFQSPVYPPAETTPVSFLSAELKTFSGQTVVLLPVKLFNSPDQSEAAVVLEAIFQACDQQTCFFPQRNRLSTRLPIGAVGEPVSATHPTLFRKEVLETTYPSEDRVRFAFFGWHFTLDMATFGGFALLLATAALGGLLLNLTPCVLPLIPIKIHSLAEAAQNRTRCLALGFSLSAGVLAFWIVLGAAMALISGFTAASQLYHYPAFTIGVGLFIAVMAVGMGGVFSMQPPRVFYLIHPRSETIPGAFIIGILTAVLSTPCSAPFMGAAAAWALSRAPSVTITTFAAIGTGMAGPYLLLSAWPKWIERFPRSGPVSQVVKEVMGLLLLAAAAYFIGTGLSGLMTTPPHPPSLSYWWVVMGLIAAAGGWLALRAWQLVTGLKSRCIAALLAITLLAGATWGALHLTRTGPIEWIYFTSDAYQAARQQRRTVVMVFTAEWCLNCKALEQSVLHSPAVTALLSREDVTAMRVDITGNNPAGRAKLKQMGALTIPLLVIISPEGKELLKSDFYTVEQIQNALAPVVN